MDFRTDPTDTLAALDSIPALAELPPPATLRSDTLGSLYGPTLTETSASEADYLLRALALHELHFRSIVEKDDHGYPRSRACTFREAFTRARQGIAWFAFAADVSAGRYEILGADGKKTAVETRANRDHVERMFGAVWVEPQRGEDEEKAKLRTRRYKAAKTANVVNWEARRAPAQPQPPQQGGLFE